MRRLFEIAEQQKGFFTTKQAKAAGFAENTHPYHVLDITFGQLDQSDHRTSEHIN